MNINVYDFFVMSMMTFDRIKRENIKILNY